MNSIWDFAPHWANWLACDRSGLYNWYECKPVIEDDFWAYYTGMRANAFMFILDNHCEKYMSTYDWKSSLQQRPTLKLDQEHTEDEFITFEEYARKCGCEFFIEKRTDCSKSQKNLIEDVETVNHPSHYNQVPGIECIDVVRYFSFNRGNAIKYTWRAGHKGNEIEDLKKAIWYLQDEIKRLEEEHKQFVQESIDKSFEEHKDVWQELANR